MRKVTVSIPFYRRPDIVMQTIKPLIHEDRVDEILMCDDCSPLEEYHRLIENTKNITKVRVVRNVRNSYVQQNKRNAISFAKNAWVLILDNDNIVQTDFFDKLFNVNGLDCGCQ